MSIYVKIGKKILKNPNIIRPHVITSDITHINFERMKKMGVEKVIFDKGNTITKHSQFTYLSKDIE